MTFAFPPYSWLILFCVALSALRVGYPLLSLRRARRAAGWPTAPAVLQLAEAQLATTRSGWEIIVRYTYEVNGATLEGRRLAFGYVPGSRAAHAEAIVQQLREARGLRVRYDPRHPSTSTLSAGVPRSTWNLLVMGVMVSSLFTVLIAAILLEDGVLPEAGRLAAQVGMLVLFPLFAVGFYLFVRTGRGAERSIAENLITG